MAFICRKQSRNSYYYSIFDGHKFVLHLGKETPTKRDVEKIGERLGLDVNPNGKNVDLQPKAKPKYKHLW